jgi:KipI family sensor histidine kinase inhibitor
MSALPKPGISFTSAMAESNPGSDDRSVSPRLLALGDAAITLEFGNRIDPALNVQVMAVRDVISTLHLEGVTDLVPTYRSLTVHFDPLRLNRDVLGQHLLDAARAAEPGTQLAERWQIPVTFGEEFGVDLLDVAQATGHRAEEVVDALCTVELRVFLIGFLPGFPYLGQLPQWLHLPRRPSPRTTVPANSVAIAGAQAAVYPWQSPGGWHLLGRTPARLFDPSDAGRPALLAPGDTVRFRSIDRNEYLRLSAAVASGEIDSSEWRAP